MKVGQKGSKGGTERVIKRERARGDKKQGECAMYIAIYVRVCKRMPETLNDTNREFKKHVFTSLAYPPS